MNPSGSTPPPPPQSPASPFEAQFSALITGLATQALIALGELPDPTTQTKQINIPMARFNIDLLIILQQKTKNNLDSHEKDLLQFLIQDVQNKFLTKG